MSLDKAIRHRKEHRRPYHGAKAIDASCRNHGTCCWCYGNRMARTRREEEKMEQEEREYSAGGAR